MTLTFEIIRERSNGTLIDDEESVRRKIEAAKNEQGDKFKLRQDVKFEFNPKCSCPNTIRCTLNCLKNNIDSCDACRKENNPQKNQGNATLDTETKSHFIM